ncbi:MAG: hypothetical protein JNG84_06340 [Archangium sp.]|nr:hypothetical protein [Archangium sp.]
MRTRTQSTVVHAILPSQAKQADGTEKEGAACHRIRARQASDDKNTGQPTKNRLEEHHRQDGANHELRAAHRALVSPGDAFREPARESTAHMCGRDPGAAPPQGHRRLGSIFTFAALYQPGHTFFFGRYLCSSSTR